MSERIRQMTGGHKCEHGALRASSSSKPYAGPVRICDCCRSEFGALQRPRLDGFPDRCVACSSPELNEIYRLTDRLLRLELDMKDLQRRRA